MKRREFFSLTLGAVQQPVFRTEARLVEVLATVKDRRGRFVAGLGREDFLVVEDGIPRPLDGFEATSAAMACAMLIDTTGSMLGSLPRVKNALANLIDAFRPEDRVAIYTFATNLEKAQEFTADRQAAKRAAFRAVAAGRTALYDAISMVSAEVSRVHGPKSILLFTDGSDNSSSLSADSALERARRAGVPVYAVAQGDALRRRDLMRLLERIAGATGGQTYEVRQPDDVGRVFAGISEELSHTYLLAFRPAASGRPGWRPVRVEIRGRADCKVRAREGYSPE
jgi:Ca-activated chloride channel family protein